MSDLVEPGHADLADEALAAHQGRCDDPDCECRDRGDRD